MIAMTPPMGWNSWDCYGASVTEEIVRKNAEFMAKNLKKYGWEYIVTDIQWYEPTAVNHEYHPFTELVMDEWGRLLPAENRFPSAKNGAGFKPLADYVHSLGLKYGIHILRGIPRQAVAQNVKIKGSDATARQIAATDSICRWNTDMYGINADKQGASAYYDSIISLYAQWGVDFIKVDDIANHYAFREIELIKSAIDKCGREMVLSISPGPTPLEQAEHLKQYVNMWRITDDFWDKWELLYDMFSRAEKWCTHACPAHFPDADMLPVGAILQDYGADGWTKFTEDEQVTMLSLWCIMRSPLMIGGELTKLDEFTLKLLTNEKILAMEKTTHCAHQVYRRVVSGKEQIVWFAPAIDAKSFYIAVFNAADEKAKIDVAIADCGLFGGNYKAEELWSGEAITVTNGIISAEINAHGAMVFKLFE